MLDPAKADEYFALHLRRSEWEAKSEDERAAALNMAEQDVSLELGGSELDYGNPLAVAAVCEQALFLLENSASGAAISPPCRLRHTPKRSTPTADAPKTQSERSESVSRESAPSPVKRQESSVISRHSARANASS